MQAVWRGQAPNGRRVLVRCYRGLGDTIQFIRYAPMLRAIAREVIVWAQPSLVPIVATVAGVDRVLPVHEGEPDAEYDVDVEVTELPYVFRTTLTTIPREVPYLSAARAQLPGAEPRVGVVWRVGHRDARRSIPFDALGRLLDVPGITWLSLQQNSAASETHPRLIDISQDDVSEAAARIRALDLLISVDSMPAHLAGALAIPVWTLLRTEADWRWMEDRDDSPWYPTMRVFRQQHDGDWGAPIEQIAKALASVCRT